MFIPTAEDRPPLMFQSPEDLKGRIIISDKPPGEPVGKQVHITICIMHCLIAFCKLLELSFNSNGVFCWELVLYEFLSTCGACSEVMFALK